MPAWMWISKRTRTWPFDKYHVALASAFLMWNQQIGIKMYQTVKITLDVNNIFIFFYNENLAPVMRRLFHSASTT